MAFGVFIHRSDSIYDDTPAERYQFPKQYLERARACVGDWIIYYEPRKVTGTRGYYAVAKVERIIADPTTSGMYLALIAPGSYLDFASPVPFSDEDGPIERGLLNEVGAISGRAQAAVRGLSSSDFNRIVAAGLADEKPLLPRTDFLIDEQIVREEPVPFVFDEARERVSAIVSRVVRDRVFRRIVLRAYDERCAVTGLKLINGGGRAEVEAAHIRPVEASGPDIVSNGLALSGTAHWMFDRGLIGLDDDMRIMISRQANDPDSIRSVINATGRILLPQREADRPHPQFVRWHREHRFKL
ncbi:MULTISPECIES: HNH endonuclease [unclassified Novosphingobium]|uniref:HNH endonuclease n=1 Tax=unclassified Novosphingobium TaxID=2644732 RepID=UPI0014426461|nr:MULTISPECIES: HNH endonuclease [unclassified Novosphingobium]MBB3359318.1 putative restriction endonuclease [Novosphingobium sp. BK256]MBB3375202.1 putative restriction endonuclease [Novosphingobium sp. BK280]MBB3380090.1 putative restriction endonuclease [Novosphingobium sp. BK258]MBB3421785.1 putative restriction endonuclease [Novosphingobium sp. BK267]MBB3450100.1 putative restriction endonuclease [Novosphingobium sp. BK352]